MRRSPALIALLLLAAACDAAPSGPPTELTIAVNAPFSTTPYLGETLAQGAELAAEEINADGGIVAGGRTYTFRIERMDSALSPQQALENVRRAVADGAVAIVDEGTGVDASWEVAAQANVPVGIVYQGGMGLVDVQDRPNVFRIAPTDRGIAFRFAEYLVPKGVRLAFLHDDTDYGQQGRESFDRAFECCPEAVADRITIPAGADPAPQVVEARRTDATALLVWARSTTLAEVIRSVRSGGWDIPIYASQTAEDPLVRQQLSDRPEWIDGLTFASGRMTAEVGPDPFLEFWAAYEEAFGPDEVGVTTSAGSTVIQPPSYAMYPYDFVKLIGLAIEAAQSTDGAVVLDFLRQVDAIGANGDERGFHERSHEGVVDDDVYFAMFEDMTYRPVDDDPLSSTLDLIQQERA